METIALTQGSKEWHAHRDIHLNASDAPAMMGCSPYKTRSQLLHEKATGFSEDFDASTQRRFDDGHKFEALARPLAEKIIGKDLYPVVGVLGKYSASFDGIDMMEEEVFEHKSLNDSLLAPDKKDLVDAIVKSKSLVDTAYANSNPLDQPQSNPRRDVATPSGL